MPEPLERSRSHRLWIPVVLLLIALGAGFYVNQREDLDRNFKAWISLGVPVLIFPLLIIWFLFLSRIRWTIRLLGLAVLVVLGLVAPRVVRIESAVNGTGLLKIAWRWEPTKDEVLAAKLSQQPQQPTGRSTSTSSAADFPQFLGPDRKNEVRGVAFDRNWKENPPKLLWRQPIGLGWSSFAVVQGRAVTQEQRGEDELVTCYDIRSGALFWAHTNHARFIELQGGDGPRATPTLVDNRAYALGGTGILDCLDLSSGRLIWSKSVLELAKQSNLTWGKSSSPLVYDDLVVVTGGRGNGPTVFAYRKNNGDLAWSAGDEEASYASPTLVTLQGKRQVLSLNAGKVISLDPTTGKLLWEFIWAPKAKWPRSSQPVAFGNDKVFFSAGYGLGSIVLKVDLKPGDTWEVSEVWSAKTMKTQFNNVSILDGFVYGIDDGFMACVDLTSGARKWKDGRYGSGQSLLVDNVLFVQDEKGPILLVEAKPGGWNEVARLDALSGKTWNNPVVANPYLLVRNDTEAACYQLPQPRSDRASAR
jgi:outer membrane protein assembly factor BamB